MMDAVKFELLFNWIGFYGFIDDVFHKRHCNLNWLQNHSMSRSKHIALVTGGARGIGYEVVKMLLEQNMHVVIGCRDLNRAKILFSEYGSRVTWEYLDVGDLESVKKFARWVQRSFPEVHLLINNAGVMCPPFRETKDGYESQFAVNYLGHFLLTHLLIPQLKAAAKSSKVNSRIVNVTSVVHFIIKDFKPSDLLQKKETYLTIAAYGRSKLAQLLFTYRLQRLFYDSNSQIETIAVHPGVVNTELFDGQIIKTLAPWFLKLCKTPQKGAVSILYSALYEPFNNPECYYVSNCSSKTPSSPLSLRKELQNDLFDFTMDLLQIPDFV